MLLPADAVVQSLQVAPWTTPPLEPPTQTLPLPENVGPLATCVSKLAGPPVETKLEMLGLMVAGESVGAVTMGVFTLTPGRLSS